MKRQGKNRDKRGLFFFFFSELFFFYITVFEFYFIFKLYITVLVLPNIKMNPPQVHMCIAKKIAIL